LFEAADIIIYIKGKGIVLKEKSLVAYNTISSKIMAFGEAALTMAENPADNIKVISPLRRGMVADYIAAVKLFTYLLSKTWEKSRYVKCQLLYVYPKELQKLKKRH
jgi:rod shape-determining protein MreB